MPPFVLPAGATSCDEFVTRAAAYLGWNVLCTDQDLFKAGPITLQQPIKVDAAGCADLLTTLLWARGLAVTPLDAGKHLYEVVAVDSPRQRVIASRSLWRTPEEITAQPNLRLHVTTIVQLKNLNGLTTSNALRPFFSSSSNNGNQGVVLGNTSSSASLILSGMQNEVASALVMVFAADREAAADSRPELAERLQQIEQRLARLEAIQAGNQPPPSGAATRK